MELWVSPGQSQAPNVLIHEETLIDEQTRKKQEQYRYVSMHAHMRVTSHSKPVNEGRKVHLDLDFRKITNNSSINMF